MPNVCAYCRKERAVNMDHVIPASVLRRRFYKRWVPISETTAAPKYHTANGTRIPEHLLELSPSCHTCNVSKGSRLLIPASWSDRLDDLNALGIGTFRVWDGSVEALREVVR